MKCISPPTQVIIKCYSFMLSFVSVDTFLKIASTLSKILENRFNKSRNLNFSVAEFVIIKLEKGSSFRRIMLWTSLFWNKHIFLFQKKREIIQIPNDFWDYIQVLRSRNLYRLFSWYLCIFCTSINILLFDMFRFHHILS